MVGTVVGYDEPLSHLLQGGSDVILVPSRFEPCGLTQLYALRYGTIPVVARTGGLADTVIDANAAALEGKCATGFQFSSVDIENLHATLERVFLLYADKKAWKAMQRAAMRQKVGWQRSAQRYETIYKSLVK